MQMGKSRVLYHLKAMKLAVGVGDATETVVAVKSAASSESDCDTVYIAARIW